MKQYQRTALVFILLFSQCASADKSNCDRILSSINFTATSSREENSANFASYLEDLMKQNILQKSELELFCEDLRREVVSNPISDLDAETSSKHLVHQEQLAKLIRNHNFDIPQLIQHLDHILNIESEIRRDAWETSEKTLFISRRAVFFEIELEGKILEVQSTLLSQAQAFFLFNLPEFSLHQWTVARTPNDKIEEVFTSDGRSTVRIAPEYPMMYISSDMLFANNGWIQQLNTSSTEMQRRLNNVMKDHDPNYIYRVMTPKEFEMFVDKAMRSIGLEINPTTGVIPNLSDEDYKNLIMPYSYTENHRRDSGLSRPPNHVENGITIPMLIDGNPFYDVVGNIKEWTWDAVSQKSHLIGMAGTDTLQNTKYHHGMIRRSEPESERFKQHGTYLHGMRLVRERR